MDNKITLAHGNGGALMHDLINDLFFRYFKDPVLSRQGDAAVLPANNNFIAFTTDSFVIDPLFFPGGDIGKLAVCGTINDLAVTGAIPLYISVSFIIEEGFPMEDLKKIVISMSKEAGKAGVKIVTGDTKVVNKGKCDKLFINTSGIGSIERKHAHLSAGSKIVPGDVIIFSGNIGDHGMAVLNARESFNFRSNLKSDCASLNFLINKMLSVTSQIRFMRDPTRGGAATVLNELAGKFNVGIEIDEALVPVSRGVKGMCELLGMDPMYIANEGKVIAVCGRRNARKLLRTMKKEPFGREAEIVGDIVREHPGKVILRTVSGGKRIMDVLMGDQLPRIC